MAYQITSTAMNVGRSPVAGLFKWNPPNICAAFYMISTDNVLAGFLYISRAWLSMSLLFYKFTFCD